MDVTGALLLLLALPQDPVLVAPLREIGGPPPDHEGPLDPRACVFARDGRLYVADAGAHRILMFAPDGKAAGSWGGPGAGPGELSNPSGLAVGPDGEIFVADTGNGRVQIFDPDGRFLFQWGASFPKDEPLADPRDVSVYGDRVLVTETDRHRVGVFGLRGEPKLRLGSLGSGPGQLNRPAGAAADEAGNIYVADAGNHRIQVFSAKGEPRGGWGTWGQPSGFLARPGGVAWHDGRLLVADTGNHRIQVFDAAGKLTRQWGAPPERPGQGGGRFHGPAHVALSRDGAWAAVAEPSDRRVQVFAYRDAPPGAPWYGTSWWDRLHARPSTPDPGAPPGPKPPGLSVLVAMADRDSHSVFFLDVTENTVSKLLARAGGFGTRLGQFNDPVSVAFDPKSRQAWVSDAGNRRIQRLSLGEGSDVRAVAAWDFGAAVPGPLALDARGRLFVLDSAASTVEIFDTKDMTRVRTLRAPAGSGPSRWEGVGVSPDGRRVFVADARGCRILVFEETGAFVASWGRRGTDPADFLRPAGVAVDAAGQVHVVDGLLNQGKTFDASGRLLRRWTGRPLHSPATIAFGTPDHLLVDDAGYHMGLVYKTDGVNAGFFLKAGFPVPGGRR